MVSAIIQIGKDQHTSSSGNEMQKKDEKKKLPHRDLNLDRLDQNQLCYHYTMGQCILVCIDRFLSTVFYRLLYIVILDADSCTYSVSGSNQVI